jgi:hypothetical protein
MAIKKALVPMAVCAYISFTFAYSLPNTWVKGYHTCQTVKGPDSGLENQKAEL